MVKVRLLGAMLAGMVLMPGMALAQSIEELTRQGTEAYNTGDCAGSEQIWRRVLRESFDNALAHHWLGYTLACQNKLDAAIASYDRAIELNPNDAIAYNNRGLALSDQGELEAAIASYDRAIELNPNYAIA
ncbi:MAG: tetratricopeptide repeat protein, partial [Cyanobacteria bacterium P01_C01_bin.89]